MTTTPPTEQANQMPPCPRWTVNYNIVSEESDKWIGTGWEFFDNEADATRCYKRHAGGVCKRPYYPIDGEHLGGTHTAQRAAARRAAATPALTGRDFWNVWSQAIEVVKAQGAAWDEAGRKHWWSQVADEIVTLLKQEGRLRALAAQPPAEAREGHEFAQFTDEELEYVYLHCDFDVNELLFKDIERKIRRQLPRFREFDALCAKGMSPVDAARELASHQVKPQVSEAERCAECGHSGPFDANGLCVAPVAVIGNGGLTAEVPCGHRCSPQPQRDAVCPYCHKRECDCSEFDVSPEMGAKG